MGRFLRTDRVLFGLALLAAVQASVFTWAYGNGPTAEDEWFAVGDTLDFLHAPGLSAGETAPAGGIPTILLVFNSECGHCLDLAPLWKDWTQTSGTQARLVAVSSEAQEVADAFVSKHGWNAAVLTVDATVSGSPNHTLTSRTPWVFALDSEGVILAEGHGKNIAEIAAVLKPERRPTQ